MVVVKTWARSEFTALNSNVLNRTGNEKLLTTESLINKFKQLLTKVLFSWHFVISNDVFLNVIDSNFRKGLKNRQEKHKWTKDEVHCSKKRIVVLSGYQEVEDYNQVIINPFSTLYSKNKESPQWPWN